MLLHACLHYGKRSWIFYDGRRSLIRDQENVKYYYKFNLMPLLQQCSYVHCKICKDYGRIFKACTRSSCSKSLIVTVLKFRTPLTCDRNYPGFHAVVHACLGGSGSDPVGHLVPRTSMIWHGQTLDSQTIRCEAPWWSVKKNIQVQYGNVNCIVRLIQVTLKYVAYLRLPYTTLACLTLP